MGFLLKLLGLSIAFVAWRIAAYYKVKSKLGNSGGFSTWFRPGTLLGETLPAIKRFSINRPGHSEWRDSFGAYKETNSTIRYVLSYIFPSKGPIFYTCDPDTIQQIVTSKAIVKPLDMYKVLSFFGQNVVIVEGQEHRRHRKVVAPAFSESNNDFVWKSSLETCRAWFKDMDERSTLDLNGEKSTVDDDAVLSTMRAALMIISAAAFGVTIPWSDNHLRPAKGHKLIFRQSIQDVLSLTIPRVLAPKWLYKISFLPQKLKTTLDETETAYTELEKYLSEFVEERKEGTTATERKDLMSLLLDQSSESESGSGNLSIREVKGNIYIFLLAGHETTAHTLAFALNFLALYPEEQEKLHQEAAEVFVDGTEPSYSDFPKLVRALAVFHETLRHFPPVPNIPKRAAEDMVLYAHTAGEKPERIPVAIPAGSDIMLDAKGLHFNPQVWEDPLAFKPDRFIDTETYRWRRDAFVPFSIGSRSCVGQKFAQVEGACILAQIAKNYRISLLPEDRAAYDAGKETFAQLQERILAHDYKITLTPTHSRILFTKR